ncbi:CIA30 family protein [Romeria aff. gracilis LEGE 07310]|uniref:CIA30 family protein n=1 Tax=Vasconcelosia minhoensis LEGE 07310 TaxID=915328 RepID=A0A8J7DMI0_9CYAN|nr:CIA30 family protein [Romeria gracilis]MBE9076715.1 CIA30 family protein [Romeria aff. gracilis LEGE 07310]
MTSESRSSWNLGRFLETLNYYGEIPFIGSFRWVQQLLGQSTNPSGAMIPPMPKQALFLAPESATALSRNLEKQLAAQDIGLRSRAIDPAATADLPLEPLLSADGLIVNSADFSPEALSSLVSRLADALGENAGVVQQPVFDFSESNPSDAWGSLDDVVMGGVSQSRLVWRDRAAVFTGRVSTDNSGGFTSVRTRNFEPPFIFSDWQGLRLRVRGDGQRYKFILRNDPGWDSPAYIYSFDTQAEQWLSINVPFQETVPTFRARSVPNAPPLDPAQIHSLQVMLSKFEYDKALNPHFEPGPFELAIASISVYRSRQLVPLVLIGAAKPDELRQQQAMLAECPLDSRLVEPRADQAELIGAIATALTPGPAA